MLSCLSRILLSIAFAGILFSCNTEKMCNENRATYLKIGVYSRTMADNKVVVKDSTLAGYAFNAVNGSETLWVDSANVKMLTLPLSQLADSSVIAIKLGYKSSNPFDYYRVKYRRSQVFINYECGFRTDFFIDTLISTNTQIDSIFINNRVVTDLDEEHIKIFLRPATAGAVQP
ncbi:MAG TPA: DUF6452 family protein [Bacteroidales bacterium]|nr:DUF6452 family protein [Bacteroidales bacterium]